MTIENGDKVKDKVSGISGIVVGVTRWATGCDTVTIQPPLKDDGSMPDTMGFDVNRVVLVESGAVSFDDEPAPMKGGPQPTVRQNHQAK